MLLYVKSDLIMQVV